MYEWCCLRNLDCIYFTFGGTDQVTTLPEFVVVCVWVVRGSGDSTFHVFQKDIAISAHGHKSSK